jgi:hypothetical protein
MHIDVRGFGRIDASRQGQKGGHHDEMSQAGLHNPFSFETIPQLLPI